MMEEVSELSLSELSSDLCDQGLYELGRALGFEQTDVDLIASRMTVTVVEGEVGSSGTTALLNEWRRRTSKEVQRRELEAALVELGLTHLAEKYCDTGDVNNDTSTATNANALSNQEDKQICSRVSDAHLDILARRFPCGQYTRFCNAVGIGYDEANSLLVRFSSDFERALRHVLAHWNSVTGGSRPRLEAALRAADVRGLCSVLDEEISPELMNSCRERATRQIPECATLQIKELNESNVAIQNLCQTQANLTSDILELARQRSELNKEIIEKTEELALLNEELHRASYSIPNIQNHNNTDSLNINEVLGTEKKELEKMKILLEDTIKRQTKKMNAFDDKIKSRVANSSEKLACLKADIADAGKKLSSIEKDVDEKQAVASKLDRKIANTRMDQRHLKKQLGNLDRNISEKKINLVNLREEEEKSVERIIKRKKVVKVLRTRINHERKIFSEVQQQRHEETKICEDITVEVNSKKRNLENMESAAVEIENKLRRLREEVEMMELNKSGLAKEILRIKEESSAQLKRAEEQINRHSITGHPVNMVNGEKMI